MKCPTFHVHTTFRNGREEWVIRREGASQQRACFRYRKAAIAQAKKIKDCRFIFVHRKDGTVQYLTRGIKK